MWSGGIVIAVMKFLVSKRNLELLMNTAKSTQIPKVNQLLTNQFALIAGAKIKAHKRQVWCKNNGQP